MSAGRRVGGVLRAAVSRRADLATAALVGWTGVVGLGVGVGVGIGVGDTAHAQDRGAVERGKAKFEHSCAPCHGAGPGNDGRAMLPGTDALRIKYRGVTPAVSPLLEERSDLSYDVLRAFVRQGSMSMPPFRPTELTNSEIREIAAYLAESARAR